MHKSLDDVMKDFETSLSDGSGLKKRASVSGGPLTVWLTAEYKAKYTEIQTRTQKQFTQVLRELIYTAIDRMNAT